MSFKYFLYLDCFSGQILTGCQRIHITDILCRIRQGICRSRIADTEAVHRLYQLVGITDIQRAAVMELYGFDFIRGRIKLIINLNSFIIFSINGNFKVISDLFK